jgi:hypothetical protein
MMKRKSYFTLPEGVIIILLALASASINVYLPIKSIVKYFGIPGPAAGMALFGGIIFVLWMSLACRISLLIHPWYGIVSPAWFGIYAFAGLLCMGVIVELMDFKSRRLAIIGGGLGNLSCLIITWLAIGIHTSVWIPLEFTLFLIFGAIISGSLGVLLAHKIT